MKVETVAFLVVLAAAGYLIALGAGALMRPERTKVFLRGFAQAKRVHVLELVVRLVIGGALVTSAPRMHGGSALALVAGLALLGALVLPRAAN